MQNAYVGFNEKLKFFARLAQMKNSGEANFTSDDAQNLAQTIASYVQFDNQASGFAITGRRKSLGSSQMDREIPPSADGIVTREFRNRASEFVEKLVLVDYDGEFDFKRVFKNTGLDPTKYKSMVMQNRPGSMGKDAEIFFKAGDNFQKELTRVIMSNPQKFIDALADFEGKKDKGFLWSGSKGVNTPEEREGTKVGESAHRDRRISRGRATCGGATGASRGALRSLAFHARQCTCRRKPITFVLRRPHGHTTCMHISIQRIDPTLALPEYHTKGAVGFDLVTRETTTVEPNKICLIPSNVIVKVPEGTMLIIVPRSSLPRKKGLICPHSIGIIDQDYHGDSDELMVQVQNITDQPVTVERGERIAQGIFVKIERAEWQEVESHGAETRGGFGSTGR